MRYDTRDSLRRQQGLSLVELLVALVIASILILGVTQIYIDNKRNYLFRENQSSNLENSRYVALLLDNYLGKAGYRRAPDHEMEDAFPAASYTDCKDFTKGSAITGLKDGDLGFCIRYQPQFNGELDCQGDTVASFDDAPFKSVASDKLVVLAFRYVAGDELHGGSLECKSLNNSAPQFIELVRGIADFRMEFGIGNNDLGEKKLKDADRFLAAASWQPTSGVIRAVRYSLLLASEENQRDGDSQLFNDWLAAADNTAKTRLLAGDQRRIYQVANATLIMRNLMP